jgi:putative ABC transport system permease protein
MDDAALTRFLDAAFAFACTRRVAEFVDVDRLIAAADVAAEPSRVARMVVRQAVALAAAGACVGLAAATVATKWLASTLYGVSSTEPSAYALAALILGASALAASYGPARRASRADPMDALRAE